MRRIQLYLDEDLDDGLNVEAARRGRSRSEIVREAVRQWLGSREEAVKRDTVDELVGSVDIEPVDELDAVVYDT